MKMPFGSSRAAVPWRFGRRAQCESGRGLPHSKTLARLIAACLVLGIAWAAEAAGISGNYAIVVSSKTQAQSDWQHVVSVLVTKHRGTVVNFESSVAEVLPELRKQMPRYVCFVAEPEEVSRQFVAQAHRLTRRLNDDPYTDCFWGILTGYDAANALRIARVSKPLVVRKAAAGTSIPLELCEEGTWYCELKKNRMVRKERGGSSQELTGPDDTTKALTELLNGYHADLWVTSGHATEHDWQIGYAYKNGSFRCENGRIYGRDTTGERFPIDSSNPKVYLAVGNCLMGHIDGRNSMALAYMNSAGVCQMVGYTVNTWYGYAGWGCLDYFIEQPGRFSLAEAFVANENALIHRLKTFFPDLVDAEVDENGRPATNIVVGAAAKAAGLTAQDCRGLLYDRDALAFYGDPAWDARMAAVPSGWEQVLAEKEGVWTLELKPRRGEKSFDVLDPNGSQRGGRPFLQFLPKRVGSVSILEGSESAPVITDSFVLIPNPGKCETDQPLRLVFRAGPEKRTRK